MNSSRILHIECSPVAQEATASRLVRGALDELSQQRSGIERLERCLVSEPLPPIDGRYASAILKAEPPQAAAFRESERLIGELETTGRLLITTPMHNFTVPAALKLWIDWVVRAHRSFALTATGKQGLLADRPTLVVISAGGLYTGDHANQPDFLTPYLKHVLATIGIQQLEFVHLQGLAMQAKPSAEMLEATRCQIRSSRFFSEWVA